MNNNKKQRMKENIINYLQEHFYVTDAELIASSFDPHWLMPRDVILQFQQKCGVLLPEREYKNWGEFVETMCLAACRKIV